MGKGRYLGLAIIWVLCAVVSLSSQNTADTANELARASQSPYDIERFVETHTVFAWGPLWKALNITEQIEMTDCGEQSDAGHNCSSELIMVLSPLQAIILLHKSDLFDEVELRFV